MLNCTNNSLRLELTSSNSDGTPKSTSLNSGSSRPRSNKKKVLLKEDDDEFMDEYQMEVDDEEPKTAVNLLNFSK